MRKYGNEDVSPTDKNQSKRVEEQRINLEKGIFGLRVELRKVEEELNTKIVKNFIEFEELRDDFLEFQQKLNDDLLVLKEEIHNRHTQFKAHINEVLLEFKESILIIQSHVDNQLVLNKR